MPSGPPELHEFWSNYYTDQEDVRMQAGDLNACRYLKEQGFTRTNNWTWTHPTYTSYDEMTQLEYDAIYYLIHEWDYGGLERPIKE